MVSPRPQRCVGTFKGYGHFVRTDTSSWEHEMSVDRITKRLRRFPTRLSSASMADGGRWWQMVDGCPHTPWPAMWMCSETSVHSINPLVIWPRFGPDYIEGRQDVVLMQAPGSDAEADPDPSRASGWRCQV